MFALQLTRTSQEGAHTLVWSPSFVTAAWETPPDLALGASLVNY